MLGSTARAMRSAAPFSICRRCASSLVLGEFDAKGAVSGATRAAVTAAGKVGGPIHVLLAGAGAKGASASASQVAGVERVFYSEDASVSNGLAEGLSALLLSLQAKSKYSHVIASATNYGRNVAPRVAVALDVAPISDVTAVFDESTFERPMYAGNAIARVKSKDPVKVLTVRGTAFEKAANGSGAGAGVEAVAAAPPPPRAAAFVSAQEAKSERPELSAAGTVVAGGRALKSAENFKIIYDLADKMGAAVGASRAAVDAGYVPNDLQVGQTGKCVAPALYVAVGISGAIQHLAGMKDSKVIVSINKDPEAPIHQVADFALVEDLFKAVPEMTSKVGKK